MVDFMTIQPSLPDRIEHGETVDAMRQLPLLPREYFEGDASFVRELQNDVLHVLMAFFAEKGLEEQDLYQDAYRLRKYIFDEKRFTEILESAPKWPSQWIPPDIRASYIPMIYGKYQEAMKAQEEKIRQQIVMIAETQIRVLVTRYYLKREYANKDMKIVLFGADGADHFTSRMRQDDQMKTRINQWLQPTGGLEAMANAFNKPDVKEVHPKAAEVEAEMMLILEMHLQMREPEKKYTVPSEEEAAGSVKSKRKQIKTKAKQEREEGEVPTTPSAFYHHLYEIWEAQRKRLSMMVIFEYPKLINQLSKTSLEENAEVAKFETELTLLWQNISSEWKRIVTSPGKTFNQIRDEFSTEMVIRLSATSAIFERYLKTVPILADVDGAPKQPSYDLLWATTYGSYVFSLYDAAYPALPKIASQRLPFLRNVPAFLTDLSVVPWKFNLMERIQNFFLQTAADDGYRQAINNAYQRIQLPPLPVSRRS